MNQQEAIDASGVPQEETVDQYASRVRAQAWLNSPETAKLRQSFVDSRSTAINVAIQAALNPAATIDQLRNPLLVAGLHSDAIITIDTISSL